jgi:hypothetical protein
MRILKNLTENNLEVLIKSFPIELKEDVEIVVNFLNTKKLTVHPYFEKEIFINNESIYIPGRIYTDENLKIDEITLSEKQKTILNCLYLTHNDGYLRQQKLELLKDNFEDFVIPYKMKILGEYVIEIIADLEKHITEKSIGNYLKFIRGNPKYWNLTKSRIISYWGEYYKRDYKLKNYIGYKLIKKIENELKLKANA